MIKPKSIIVIFISSFVISLVLVLTIAGLSLYLGWKEKDSERIHSVEIDKLNASLYEKFIDVSDLKAKKGKEGIFKDNYIIEGLVKNNGFRTVSSISLEIDFLNASREAIHTETFKPLQSAVPSSKLSIGSLFILTSGKELPLARGQSMRFKHILSCQKKKDVVSPIKNNRFATNPNEWSGRFSNRVNMIKF